MKKSKAKKKRKLLLSLLMLLVAGAALTTSTYAWFTANKTVSVNDINVNVSSTNGIQVSVDGINWKAAISNADITSAISTYPKAINQLPTGTSPLSPVSTIGEVDTTVDATLNPNGFGLLKMFNGEITADTTGDYILNAIDTHEVNGTTGNYIAFDLFLKVTNDIDVSLTSASKVTHTSGADGIQNAARIAFVVEDNIATGSTTSAIQALTYDDSTGGEGQVIIWEPNYDTHTATGVSNASDYYGITVTAGADNAIVPYEGVKAPIEGIPVDASSADPEYASLLAPVTPAITTKAEGIADKEALFRLKGGITKVRVYMWVEGQDIDCENDASGGSITFSLAMSVPDEQA